MSRLVRQGSGPTPVVELPLVRQRSVRVWIFFLVCDLSSPQGATATERRAERQIRLQAPEQRSVRVGKGGFPLITHLPKRKAITPDWAEHGLILTRYTRCPTPCWKVGHVDCGYEAAKRQEKGKRRSRGIIKSVKQSSTDKKEVLASHCISSSDSPHSSNTYVL